MYEEDFEKLYLTESAAFYRMEWQKFLEKHIKKVGSRIIEEFERAGTRFMKIYCLFSHHSSGNKQITEKKKFK